MSSMESKCFAAEHGLTVSAPHLQERSTLTSVRSGADNWNVTMQVTSKRQRLGPPTLGCDVNEGGVVVSVMLPTRQGVGASEPSLTSVEQIYVVVLKPSKQYTTYACSLPKAMYV